MMNGAFDDFETQEQCEEIPWEAWAFEACFAYNFEEEFDPIDEYLERENKA